MGGIFSRCSTSSVSANDDDDFFDEVDLPSDESSSSQEHDFAQLLANADSSSFPDVFKYVSGIALPMSLSFTFSFEVFLSVVLLQLLSETEDDTAAATLVSTLMNTLCVVAMCPLLTISILLTNRLGEWRKLTGHQDGLSMAELTDDRELEEIGEDTDEETGERNPLAVIATKKAQIESIGMNSIVIGSATTIPCWLSLYFSRPIMTEIFQQNESVAISAERFLRPYSFAVPALMLRVSFGQCLFSFGRTNYAMLIALGNFVVGAGLSLLLGFGVDIGSLEFPRLNQTGVALGFVFETYLTAITYGLFLKFDKICRQFDLFKLSPTLFRQHLDGFKEMLRFGGSITFSFAVELSLTLAVGIFSGLLGTTEQSAMSYCLQFIYFEFIMLAAFSLTCSQEVSRAIGANSGVLTRKLSEYGLLTALIYLTPLPVFFAIYPDALETIAGGASEEVSDMLRTLVPLMSAGVIMDNVRYNLLQQLRPFNDLSVPNLMALIGMSTGIGLAALFAFPANLGVNGVAMGYMSGIGITATALFARWRGQLKKLDEGSIVEVEDETKEQTENQALVSRSQAGQGLWQSVRGCLPCSTQSQQSATLNHSIQYGTTGINTTTQEERESQDDEKLDGICLPTDDMPAFCVLL